MKIKLSSFCWQCFNETTQTEADYKRLKKEFGEEDVEVEFNNDNSYNIKCGKGHVSHTQLQNQKFELLFDIAAMALIDGYTKECVSTIASSFERFIEFYIKVIAIKKKVNISNFIDTWKTISKQSERQLGSFYILQLTEYGESKYIISTKWIEFRNKVIHQGYIPSTHETIEYGEYILSMMYSILLDLKKEDLGSIDTACLLDFNTYGKIISEKQLKSSATIPTIISLHSLRDPKFGSTSFKEAIESIPKNGFYKHFYSKFN
jgi:hypothetical protein